MSATLIRLFTVAGAFLLLAAPVHAQTPSAEEAEERGIDVEAGDAVAPTALPHIPVHVLNRSADEVLLIANSTSAARQVNIFDHDDGDLVVENYVHYEPQFTSVPVGIVPNFAGNGFYISVQTGATGNVIYEYDAQGDFVGIFAPVGGHNPQIMENIRGMAYTPDGQHLAVAVAGGDNAHSIALFDNAGQFAGYLVEAGTGGLQHPWGILFRETDILVTASGSNGVHRFDYQGNSLGMFADLSSFPYQIIQAANGNVIVVNSSGAAVRGVYEYSPDGTLVQSHLLDLTSPRGVHELANGNLLVAGSAGVHEIDRNTGAVVSVKWDGGIQRMIGVVPASAVTLPNGVMTIAEARALGSGATVTVEGTVTRAMGAFAYFQDETAGLTIRQTSGAFFDDVAAGTITSGTEIRVTGTLSTFGDLMQINEGDLDEYSILGQGDAPAPQVITLDDIDGDSHQAQLVHVQNAWFPTASGTFSAATTYDVTDASIDPDLFDFRIPNASDTEVNGMDIPEALFDFTGVVGHFFDGPQLLAILETDIEVEVEPELIEYWNFNTPATHAEARNNPWPQPIAADFGDGFINYNFVEDYIESFGGTELNAQFDDPAGQSFVVEGGTGQVNNDRYFDINVSTATYADLVLRYATQGSISGFTTQTAEFSVDGGDTWTLIGEATGTNTTPFFLVEHDLSGFTEINNKESVIIRITVDGASDSAGNNRFDNITLHAGESGLPPPTDGPLASFTPPIEEGIEVTLDADATTTAMMTIHNIGEADLEFDFIGFSDTRDDPPFFFEDFETTPVGELPPGWSAFGNEYSGGNSPFRVVNNTNLGLGAFSDFRSAPEGEVVEDYLVTPAIDLGSDSSIEFLAARTWSLTWISFYEVLVSTTVPDDPDAFTTIFAFDSNDINHANEGGTVITVDLSDYDLTTVYIAFLHRQNSDSSLFIDDVAIYSDEVPNFVSDVSPAMGTVVPGASVDVTVTFDASGFIEGTYSGNLLIDTNVPATRETITYAYPVKMNVEGEAGCVIEPDPIAFGEVIIGFDHTLEAMVTNEGTADCVFTGAVTDEDDFTVDFEAVTLVPGASADFSVTFAPTSVGTITGTLTLEGEGAASAGLSGVGLAPPEASVEPTELFFQMEPNTTMSQTVTLSNEAGSGAADLEFLVSVAAARADRPLTGTIAGGRTRPAGQLGTPGRDATAGVAGHGSVERLSGVYGGPFPQTEFGRGDGDELIQDGSFEAGTPNSFWDEASTNFGTPLCDVASCGTGTGTGPNTGAWWAWFGGTTSAETGHVSQEVEIPFGGAEMSFYLEIPVAGTPGWMRVSIGDDVIFEATDADAANYATYTQVVVDASAYADGNVHEVKFEGSTQAGATTNFFIDDVSLISTGPDMISVAPTEGSIEPGASQDLTVTIDTEGIEEGAYSFELLIQTNDPANPVLTVDVHVVVVVDTDGGATPLTFELGQNYPNPFAQQTTIEYALAESGPVHIAVYDVAGRVVATLVDAEMEAGTYTTTWNANGVASGVYFYRIQAGAFTQTQRALIVR